MAPPYQRLLQSAVQKHNAAPTPIRKRRHLIPSPLIACPEVGIIPCRHRNPEKLPSPFRFYPKRHAACEKTIEQARKPIAIKITRDIKRINTLLPIDILIRSLKQQAAKAKVPMDPIPIRLKLSPQMRRVKNKKNFRKVRSHRKKPESGRLIPLPNKPSISVETIMASPLASVVEATPTNMAKVLIHKLLDCYPQYGVHTSLSEVIGIRRQILYLEEGAVWMPMMWPGVGESNSRVPLVFKLFDNTDEGISEEMMQKRNEYGSLTTYQFRVLAKRFSIKGLMDLPERILFAAILGMTEEAVHTSFLEMCLDEEKKGLTDRQVRNLFYRTYRAATKMKFDNEEDDSLEVVRMYERVMFPKIQEVFAC